MESRFYQELYKGIVIEAGIEIVMKDVPEGVEVTHRENEMAEYIFVQNFGREKAYISLPEGYQCIYGNDKEEMFPLETKVLKKEK